MRLSEFIEHPELKKRGIAIVGYIKTMESEFALLTWKGESVFPFPKLYHLVEVTPNERDPDLGAVEQRSILSRFGYFDAISALPKK